MLMYGVKQISVNVEKRRVLEIILNYMREGFF